MMDVGVSDREEATGDQDMMACMANGLAVFVSETICGRVAACSRWPDALARCQLQE